MNGGSDFVFNCSLCEECQLVHIVDVRFFSTVDDGEETVDSLGIFWKFDKIVIAVRVALRNVEHITEDGRRVLERPFVDFEIAIACSYSDVGAAIIVKLVDDDSGGLGWTSCS